MPLNRSYAMACMYVRVGTLVCTCVHTHTPSPSCNGMKKNKVCIKWDGKDNYAVNCTKSWHLKREISWVGRDGGLSYCSVSQLPTHSSAQEPDWTWDDRRSQRHGLQRTCQQHCLALWKGWSIFRWSSQRPELGEGSSSPFFTLQNLNVRGRLGEFCKERLNQRS